MRLSSISYDELLPILKKMNAKSLCRLRQASKWIDNFVENNRYRISCRPENKDLVLFIEGMESNKIRSTISEGFLGYDDRENKFSFEGEELFGQEISLQNPFQQLSGIHISMVHLRRKKWTQWYDNHLENQKAVYKNKLRPLFKELRISCEYLMISGIYLPERIVSHIRFKRLFMEMTEIYLEDCISWKLENCSELNVKHLPLHPLPYNIFFLIRNFERFTFEVEGYTTDVVVYRFISFLKEIIQNRAARGRLEFLSFGTYERVEFYETDIPGLVEIWRGHYFNAKQYSGNSLEDLIYYKLPIDGGLAIIENFQLRFAIHFLPRDDRQSIFDFFLSECFKNIPIDASALYENFISTKDEKTAFADFNKACLEIYRCYPKYRFLKFYEFPEESASGSDVDEI